MFIFLLVLHAIVAACLVAVILMQKSEGGGLGMGGSPSGLMSARGAADFLTRATAVLASLFVLLSIVMAVLAATRHTSRMADQRELSHRLSGEADLASRITAAGYRNWRMLAENLAWGQASPRAVLRAWVHSPGHRANLDNCRLRDIGIGVEIRSGRPWVTADFGRHRR